MILLQPRIITQDGVRRATRPIRSHRRILCVFPRYTPSFGTFQHAYPLMPGVRAFMPPQGLLVIAAYLPKQWDVRFIDENIRPASDDDFEWADAVFISGMHVQRRHIHAINEAAHRHGKITALGGPSVSGCTEYYPDVDLLHLGELGDATDSLIEYLDITTHRPQHQLVFQTSDRLPLEQFPIPAYHLLNLRRYFLGSIQFSSGCPYMCEFCDIPALYGRNPRLKTPEQICAELDAIVAAGCTGAVYFVDDNFIANRNAAAALLPHLIRWQQSRGYPLEFNCEATLNIAACSDLLEQMREAAFHTIFCGIETPEPDALRAMKKQHNLRQPILEAVRTINDHGMEVVSGIIMGLDTDTPQTADHILDFINASRIPMLTINLLYALPKTPLYERLQREGRIIAAEHAENARATLDPELHGNLRENQATAPLGRESNVIFKLPYEQVRAMWMRCISEAYEPQALLDRFAHQCAETFSKRLQPPRKVSASQVIFGMRILRRVLWQCGVRNDWRRLFWKTAGPLLKNGRVEEVIHLGIVAHHLIAFTRDCQSGRSEACFYADPAQQRPLATVRTP